MLAALVARRGHVVSKDELFARVWNGLAVTDDSLVQCVVEIRRALGPARTALRTVPGRGYHLAEASPPEPVEVEPIRFARSHDGVRIAWTATGRGAALLKAPNWISHLGHERRSLLYAPFYERLGHSARIVRLDQRGNGMSDWNVPPLSVEDMVRDLEVVADAAGLERFFLYGMSQGAAYAIAFAARHPERVRGIITSGARAIGSLATGDPAAIRSFETALAVVRGGWDAEDPSYRRYFTARIVPDASPDLAREYDELQRLSLPPANVEAYLRFAANLDVREEAARLRVPVLMLHSRGDRMVPLAISREVAALIPDARLVELDGDNHIVIPGTPAFEQALSAIEGFLDELG